MSNICDLKKCTGCFTCINSCPRDAISVKIASSGKTIPEIDNEKCINCNLCRKNCPVNKDFDGVYPTDCVAAQWKSDERINSASGGVATAIGYYALDNNVHIFGSVFDDDFTLSIRELRDRDDLAKASGSKYVQSNVGLSFRQVKNYLLNGDSVVYVGTPCQIDGLRSFLGKKYDNLVTIDIVCHGNPPYSYFKTYLKEKKFVGVTSASFRGKNDYYLCLFNKTNMIYKRWHKRDLYFQAFDEGIINRDNCYSCRYANPNRVSDITIGDFWGLNRSELSKNLDGKISVVLINTEKGRTFWNNVEHLFVTERRPIDEAVKGNPHLHKCNPASENYMTFSSNYVNMGFSKAIKKTGIHKRMLRLWLRDMKKRLLK